MTVSSPDAQVTEKIKVPTGTSAQWANPEKKCQISQKPTIFLFRLFFVRKRLWTTTEWSLINFYSFYSYKPVKFDDIRSFSVISELKKADFQWFLGYFVIFFNLAQSLRTCAQVLRVPTTSEIISVHFEWSSPLESAGISFFTWWHVKNQPNFHQNGCQIQRRHKGQIRHIRHIRKMTMVKNKL